MIFVGALPIGGGGGVSSGDVAAAIAAERAATTARTAGLPCSIGSTEIAASGSLITTTLTMPSGLVATGRHVGLSGTATLRAASDGALLGTWRFEGVDLVRLAATPWWERANAGDRAPDDGAGLADYLSDTDTHAPRLGWDSSTGAVVIGVTLRADAPGAALLAFSGAAANLGTAL